MFKRHAFDSILLLLTVMAFNVNSYTSDSYTIGIQENKSKKPWKNSKLSTYELGDFCGGIFRERQVIIKSPRYPNNYPKNTNCDYVFYSPFVCTTDFHIQFLDFQLEPSLSCSKDRIVINTDELLCGQVIGIMKYKATNGTLRIKFISDESIENKGFQLLVTRLPCSSKDSSKHRLDETTTLIPSESQTIDIDFEPKQNNVVPINSVTAHVLHQASETFSDHSIVKPTCISETVYTTMPAIPNIPSCCLNTYNQKKFYLISPGFPNDPQFLNDCLYFVEKSHSNICRLRIEFKYFLLGDWQQCSHSFLEIDGRRFCGCKTGLTYYSQWGSSPKSIRFVNMPRFGGNQGFILEITQEECPYRTVDSSSFQKIVFSKHLTPESPLMHINDPRRCSYNYILWLNSVTNQALLARSICIRNYG